MSEIGFYHLTRTPLEMALPKLLEKALGTGARVLVRIGDPNRLDALDRALWTYDRDSFLPHGTPRDGDQEQQPVLLTTEPADNPNGAQILVLVDRAHAEDAAAFSRCLELFDGRDPDAVESARGRWRWAGEKGIERVYWQQDERGRWRRAGGSRETTTQL